MQVFYTTINHYTCDEGPIPFIRSNLKKEQQNQWFRCSCAFSEIKSENNGKNILTVIAKSIYVDLHPVYISQVESGKKAVSVEALWKISKALHTPISQFFRGI